MPRAPKLCRHKGHWCTKSGSTNGVYFGKIGEVSYREAKERFAKYLADLNNLRQPADIPNFNVAKICDEHLKWCRRERSTALFSQRRTLLTHLCRHPIGMHNGQKLPGHGKQLGTMRAVNLTRAHVEQYLSERSRTPTKKTGKVPKDKTIRNTIVAIKACWNWAADGLVDGGGGLMPDTHRPLAKLPRGYVAPKDLTEADLPTDEEIEILFQRALIDPTQVQVSKFQWRKRLPEENCSHDAQIFTDMLHTYHGTGARTGELCSALVRDYMPRTSQICLGKHKRVRTQHNPTVRNIQIDGDLVEVLKRNVLGRPSEEPLFVRENGRPWNPSTFNRHLKRVIAFAVEQGMIVRSHITPYSFRDLYISELLMIGTEPFKVAKMAGTSLRELELDFCISEFQGQLFLQFS